MKILQTVKTKLLLFLSLLTALFAALCCLFTTKTVQSSAEENSLLPQTFTCDGASIKLMMDDGVDNVEKSGLRFEFSMSEAEFQALLQENVEPLAYLENVQMGAVYVPSDLFAENMELDLSSPTAEGSYVKHVKFAVNDWWIREGKAVTYVNIYDWPENSYRRNVLARAYVQVGEEIVYTETVERSMSYVASMALRTAEKAQEGEAGYLEQYQKDHISKYLTNYTQEILSNNLENTIIKKTSGQYKDFWEITAAQTEDSLMHEDGIRFSSVVDKTFFVNGYEYISFDIIMENVQAFSIATLVNGEGTVDDWSHINNFTYSGGTLLDVHDNVRVYDINGNPVGEMENGKQYTVRIHVPYDPTATIESADVHFGFQAINMVDLKVWCSSPTYYKQAEFLEEYEFYPYTTNSAEATPTRVMEGERAGQWQLSATTLNGLEGSNGLKFSGLVDKTFFNGTYKYVQFEMTMQNVAAIQGMVNINGNSLIMSMNDDGLPYDTPIANVNEKTNGQYNLDPNYWTFYDTNNNRVTALENGRPYTVRLYIPNDGRTIANTDVYLGFTGNGQAPTVWISDPVYTSAPILYTPYFTEGAGANIVKHFKTVNGQQTNEIEYYTLTSAENNLRWNNGLKIYGLSSYDGASASTADYDRVFFDEGCNYVEFKMRMSGVSALEANYQLTGGGDYKRCAIDWTDITALNGGKLDGTYWQFYDANGTRVYSLSADGNTWYTVRLVAKNDGTAITATDIYLGFEGTNITVDITAPKFDVMEFDYFTTSATGATVTKETEGDFAGKWKVEQTQTGNDAEIVHGNGIRFTDLYTDGTNYGEVYKGKFEYVSVKFYVTGGQAMSMYANITPGANGISTDWVPMNNLKYEDRLNYNYFYFYDENGTRVDSLENGKWYTLVIYLNYWKDNVITDANVSFGFQPAEGGKVTVYLEDPVYSYTNPMV